MDRLTPFFQTTSLIVFAIAKFHGSPAGLVSLNSRIREHFDSHNDCVECLTGVLDAHPNIRALFQAGLVLGFSSGGPPNDALIVINGMQYGTAGRAIGCVPFRKGALDALQTIVRDGGSAFLDIDFDSCTIIDVAHAVLELDAHQLIAKPAEG